MGDERGGGGPHIQEQRGEGGGHRLRVVHGDPDRNPVLVMLLPFVDKPPEVEVRFGELPHAWPPPPPCPRGWPTMLAATPAGEGEEAEDGEDGFLVAVCFPRT